jgi:hypothetical protein
MSRLLLLAIALLLCACAGQKPKPEAAPCAVRFDVTKFDDCPKENAK